MSKGNFSGIPPFITVNATTAGPNFLNPAITKSNVYAEKTRWVVLSTHEGKELANVFRRSHSVPGSLSRDVFEWKSNEWHCLGKDPQKHPVAPDPPPEACASSIEGVDVWTMHALTLDQIERIRILMRRL
jgi:hypothetical protein